MRNFKFLYFLVAIIIAICVWQVMIPAFTENSNTSEQAQQVHPVAPIPIKTDTKVSVKPIETDTKVSVKPNGVEAEKDFYQTIIDHNLFRPLGFRPSTPGPKYSLVGTNIASQESETIAMILEHSSNQQHIVREGQRIGKHVLVKEIKNKQVILQDGDEVVTLQGPQIMFLNNR